MTRNDLAKEKTAGFPRPGSVLHNIARADSRTRKKTINQFKLFNKLVVPLYRLRILPLFGMGRLFLVLTTKGHKSGKIRRNPLELMRIDGNIHIFCSRGEKSHWFRNMQANPGDVKVQVGFRSFTASFDVLEGVDFDAVMKYYVKKRGKPAKSLFGWDPKNDDPETADFSSLAKIIKIIRLSKKK